jgi:S-adenosyl methyltransferase
VTGSSGTQVPDRAPRADHGATDTLPPGMDGNHDTADAPRGILLGSIGHAEDDSEVGERGGPAGLDTGRAHPARIYDYWVGGRDNFAADRQAGAQVAELAPWVVSGARGNRAFLGRAVSWLAETGVVQFLDIGAGLPGAGNVHEIAQAVNPAARTVYVDNDELVLVHARALLARDARTVAVAGDARDPAAILADPDVRSHLDLGRPVAVLLVALLHFIVDQAQAAGIVASLRDRLAPGSYLAISHVADLPDAVQRPGRAAATRAAADLYDSLASPFALRSPEQITALFDGFDLVPPGVVPAHLWHPRRGTPGAAIPVLTGIGHLPGGTTAPGTAQATSGLRTGIEAAPAAEPWNVPGAHGPGDQR